MTTSPNDNPLYLAYQAADREHDRLERAEWGDLYAINLGARRLLDANADGYDRKTKAAARTRARKNLVAQIASYDAARERTAEAWKKRNEASDAYFGPDRKWPATAKPEEIQALLPEKKAATTSLDARVGLDKTGANTEHLEGGTS